MPETAEHTPEAAAREVMKPHADPALNDSWMLPADLERRIADAISAAERRGAEMLLGDDPTLTVNILRAWDRDRIERFCLHLLGDAYQNLFVEWQRRGAEAEREACAEIAAAEAREAMRKRQTNETGPYGGDYVQGEEAAADRIEMAIRARSEKGEGE